MRIKGVNPKIWYEIPGYGGKYQINYAGNIRRILKDGCFREVHPYIKKSNRRRVVKLNCKEHVVMKLMQMTFIGELPKDVVTYHRNGLLTDDCLSNIGMMTRKELGKATGQKNDCSIKIVKLNPEGEVVDCYKSAREAGRVNHMSYQSILDRINGKVKGLYAPDGYVYARDSDREIQKAVRNIELEQKKECGCIFTKAPEIAFDF